jgi:DNA-binding NtrC family response regulator
VHLLFTDVVLPDNTGLSLTEELLGKQPGLKVVLSSGYVDEKSQWPVIQKKGFPFLPKPYTPSELLRAVRKTLSAAAGPGANRRGTF